MIPARYGILGVLAFGLSLCGTGIAVAQTATPQQTTATYEDWVVRCETHPGPPAQKNCEMVQLTQMKGQGVISQIAIGQPAKGQPIKIMVQVPLGVWLPTGVKISVNAKDPGLPASFKRCLGNACIADADIKEDAIKRLRAITEPGQIQFKDGAQKDIALPLSFRGFAAAFDALAKE